MRATENADLTLGDLAVVLERHFVVPGTKTVNAARSSVMTDGVYKRMTQYVHSRRGDDLASPAFPNALGKQRDRHSVAWFVDRVADRARLLAERENRPFPRRDTARPAAHLHRAAAVTPEPLRPRLRAEARGKLEFASRARDIQRTARPQGPNRAGARVRPNALRQHHDGALGRKRPQSNQCPPSTPSSQASRSQHSSVFSGCFFMGAAGFEPATSRV